MSNQQLSAPPPPYGTLDVPAATAALEAFVERLKSIPRAHQVGAGQVEVVPGRATFNTITDALNSITDASQQKEYTVYVYDGVQHAFNNDTSAARYDKAAAELAWSRTIDFLKQKLS